LLIASQKGAFACRLWQAKQAKIGGFFCSVIAVYSSNFQSSGGNFTAIVGRSCFGGRFSPPLADRKRIFSFFGGLFCSVIAILFDF
jgi:hypothetical protein